ncbi:MAG: tRNA (N6-isopentenyl adenosine(37)-C2)-methylthiotransferase MiaB [Chitinispirillaceae bacterium]|nr:tRNA (N6-isopentenyl adenosine(37)-C2)-methylthiotransferase MiaB [Chitinispirillaceae bacterium]
MPSFCAGIHPGEITYFFVMPSVYFQTFGCQMNVADSVALMRALALRGYAPADAPDKADLIVVNTCSVRERAEARALARIAEFAAIRKRRRGARLWVIGCMAERLGETLKDRLPGIDAVIGAPRLADAAAVVEEHLGKTGHDDEVASIPGVSEFVPIARGCNNYCSYCIVPYVRGPERSIPADTLVASLRTRVAAGVREITVLGQNVNSYSDNGVDFPDLLQRIASIDGLDRIRFTTSHPKDATEKLIRVMATTPKLCRHLHLPAQSGSDRILGLMNRNYTAAHYRSLVSMARSYMPDADITTDLLVGFPTETEEEFNETLDLVREMRFTAAFMFAYSVREGTAAARMTDTVPRGEKISRLERLIRLQTSITREIYESMVGRRLEIMVYDRVEKKNGTFLRGQDHGCKRVLAACPGHPAGTILTVQAVRSSGMTLIAERMSL